MLPFSTLPTVGLYGPIEETPAAHDLLAALHAGDVPGAVHVATRHWEEIWWALPPPLTGEIVSRLPPEALEQTPGLQALAALMGTATDSPSQRVADASFVDEDTPSLAADRILVRAIALRLEGRAQDALDLLDTSPEDYSVFGHLREDTSGGRMPSRRLSIGLIATLAEQHGRARQQLGAAARAHAPVRFPWVPRAASALLALSHALEADHPAARLWMTRAEALPRTRSWGEKRSDEYLALARLHLAVDTLDLDLAQRLIEENPSPFDHSYLWPFAADVYTQYHLLRRQPQTAQAMWREILDSTPPAQDLQGAPRRSLLEVPLWMSLATESHADAAAQMERAETPENDSLSILADYVAGNLESALLRASALLPRVQTDPRVLMRLLGIVAACHHSAGNLTEREATLDLLLARAEVFGLWAAVAFSPAPLRESILARNVPGALRDLLTGPAAPSSTVPAISEALTPAEADILRLVAAGRNRKEMSTLLHLSENTVKTHLRHIYRKLGVSSRAQAVERANEVRALVLRESPTPR